MNDPNDYLYLLDDEIRDEKRWEDDLLMEDDYEGYLDDYKDPFGE